jgi:hypothetical protein
MNNLDLEGLAAGLLAVRAGPGGPAGPAAPGGPAAPADGDAPG